MKKFVLVSLMFLAACGTKTPDPNAVEQLMRPFTTVEEVLSNYPKAVAAKFGAVVPPTGMFHLVMGQPTPSTDIAMVVLMDVQTTAGTTGRHDDQILGVFSKVDGKYVFRDQRRVGGRQFRKVVLKRLEPTRVTLDATFATASGVEQKATLSYGLEPYQTLEELSLILDSAGAAAPVAGMSQPSRPASAPAPRQQVLGYPGDTSAGLPQQQPQLGYPGDTTGSVNYPAEPPDMGAPYYPENPAPPEAPPEAPVEAPSEAPAEYPAPVYPDQYGNYPPGSGMPPEVNIPKNPE